MKNLYLALSLCFVASAAWAQKPQFEPGQLIVQTLPGRDIKAIEADLAQLDGEATNIKVEKLLSPQMRAWLVTYNPNMLPRKVLDAVFSHPAISVAQFNHIISPRETVPNDPQLNQQWQHINSGGGGATADADVDSDLAWDITTGGLTATGDTIVVCIVDDGTNLTHPDLLPNSWFNHNEIPNNSIDDDGNGYVDDYRGWNAANNNDNVTGGSHGVNVNGMVGAKGNNNTGVVGVNWDVKMMTVKYGQINEAAVIQAYTYPLTQRQLYESTGGQKGAFVVAINSSWGINNGQPSSAPLWCAFYDTLGAYGILSAGATSNSAVNVDVVGDLPTACPSEYLLSVTATNNSDVRTFSGYGQTTIDLAAPGEDVRTTSGSNSYTTTSGTSFASPMVAGAIGLLYSAPCASLAAIAHASPSIAAEMVRDHILNGVDPKPNLTTECVTGGRLNLHGALNELMANCSGSTCIAPFSLTITNIGVESANFNWLNLPDQTEFNVQYGPVGGTQTVVNNVTGQSFSLSGLAACVAYQITVEAICNGETSGFATPIYFTTDGCCTAPAGLSVSGISTTEATVTWNPITAANTYTLQWRAVGEQTWQTFPSVINQSVVLSSFEACTAYEVQVASNCAGGQSDFSSSVTFTTLGCGACTDNAYCTPDGNVEYEWIAKVVIDQMTNNSAGPSAYGDYTGTVIDLWRDSTYAVSFKPGFQGFQFTERFRLWVDLNQNGLFTDNGEMLYDSPSASSQQVNGTIAIPANAQLGTTRLRVGMTDNSGYPHSPCATLEYGEWEDYCVRIIEKQLDTTSVHNLAALRLMVYPNPANDQVFVAIDRGVGPFSVQLVDQWGRLCSQTLLNGKRGSINLRDLNSGIYTLLLSDASGNYTSQRVVVAR